MVFWGPHRNSKWQKKCCCNLFQVKPYFAWTNMDDTEERHRGMSAASSAILPNSPKDAEFFSGTYF